MSRINLLIATALGISTLIAASLGVAGCDDERRKPADPTPIASNGAPPFHPPSYPAGRTIDTIASTRIDGGRVPVFIVGSRNDTAQHPGRIDFVEIFALDSVNARWTRVLSDSVESALRIELRDITGDGHPDIMLPLYSGGNDNISSNGLQVYSADGGGLRRVFRSTWMDPQVDSLPCVRERVITVRRALWPLFAPRSDAVVYIDDVFGFRDGRFRSIAGEAAACFREEVDKQQARYRTLRDSIEKHPIAAVGAESSVGDSAMNPAGVPDSTGNDSLTYGRELHVFQSVAVVVLNMVRAGDVRGARTFWSQQRAFIRSVLRAEQYDELEAFCKPLIAAG